MWEAPRKGNSEYLLEKALKGAMDYDPSRVKTDIFSFRGKKMNPCLACDHCIKNDGACIHNDHFQILKELWLNADAIIYSLPVYHMSMPGQVKCFIDRLGNSMFGSHHVTLSNGTETLSKQLKAIGTIAQGIHIFSGQEHTITDMINHTLIMQCVPVTGDMWEAYIGVGGWTKNRISRSAINELKTEEDFAAQAAVHASEVLGRRVVETADLLLCGLEARKEILKHDPQYDYVLSRLEQKERN
ncbi:hypothetical protein ES705_31786 [subsurface metagenome]